MARRCSSRPGSPRRSKQPTKNDHGVPKMDDEKNVKVIVGAAIAPTDDDEDTREFEALIRDIADLRDPETVVEHMDIETYRKGRRP